MYVLMNRFPYNNGHLLVMPKTHSGRLDGLDDATFAELHATLRRAVKVLEAAGFEVALPVGRKP